jgi:hypothetical protein
VSAWRARLAAIREGRALADDGAGAVLPPPEGANDTTGPFGNGMESAKAGAAAFYRKAAVDAAEALRHPDQDLIRERAEIAAARVGEALGGFTTKPAAEHLAEISALRLGGLLRPPCWSNLTSPPPPGAWCSCCGRFTPEAGGRWWREAKDPSGWRCFTCHPPPPRVAVVDVRT